MNTKNLEMIEQAINMMESGDSMRTAAKALGVSPSTLSVWIKKVNAADGDIDAAFDDVATAGGRPQAIAFTERELALAKWFRLAKESVDVAAYFFARDERVSIEVKEAIRVYEDKALETGKRIGWPMSVRRAFEVTDEEKAAFRGKKHSQQVEMITRRGMFEVMADGSVQDILPGDTWELDDYSTNQPFVYEHPETGEKMLGRQILGARDLSGAFWLGFDHIGRERDAYRSEDVLRYIERLVRSHGMPKRLRLERGIWESSGVHGIAINNASGNPIEGTFWGDLRDLMMIEHVFKSKSKSIIEGGFNMLQRFLAHTGTDIGRTRGEFEEATKRYLSARSKNVDPSELGFLSQEKSSQLHNEAGRLINSRPMHRGHLNERVSPDDLVARLGWHTGHLSEADAWYFLPCKQNRIVRAGTVEVNPGGGWPNMQFQINGIEEGLHLESGHRILVACDPARPDLGAYICNRETGARNREGYGMAEHLMTAPHLGLSPQFNASEALTPHLVARRKASAAARTTFRSITTAATSKKSKVEKTMTDGKGKAVHVGTIPREVACEVKGQRSKVKGADETVIRAGEHVKPERNEKPAQMSRFSGRDAASEIEKLTKSLTD